MLESTGGTCQLSVNFSDEHLLDRVLHLRHCPAGMIQSENRQHAAHLRQLTRHLLQMALVVRIAEKFVQELFKLAQRHAQFVYHAAHGLLVADPAIQALHPAFEWLGCAAHPDLFQTICQTGRADNQLRISGIKVFKCGFQIQHRSGHFHGQFNARRLAGACS